jgi:hypothetical protein
MTPAPRDIPADLRAWLADKCLTPRQFELVAWFHVYQQAHSMAPTMQEVADGMGVSKVTVFEHVNAATDKGVFDRDFHRARSLRLLWDPTVKDLTAACKRYRAAAELAVGRMRSLADRPTHDGVANVRKWADELEAALAGEGLETR